MRVITEYDVIRHRVNVYVESSPGYWLDHDNQPQQFNPGATIESPPLYMWMPIEVAEVLKQELEGKPAPATTRHLDDAIATRDRLFALVEKLVP